MSQWSNVSMPYCGVRGPQVQILPWVVVFIMTATVTFRPSQHLSYILDGK